MRSSTCPVGLKNEFPGLRKARKRLDGRIEESIFGEGVAFANEYLCAGGVTVALNGYQPATVAKLGKKCCRDFLHRTVDEDKIIGCGRGVTLSKISGDNGDVGAIQSSKGLFCLGSKHIVAFERDDRAGQLRKQSRRVASAGADFEHDVILGDRCQL